jgi:histidyl-tRNA synthetase
LEKEVFEEEIQKQVGEKKDEILEILEIKDLSDFIKYGVDEKIIKDLEKIQKILLKKNINSVIFDITLMRGFDYYTGIVFEFFDTHPENNRSLFGGGRYDDLLDIFGQEKIPAIGFGMGDVTAKDFLEIRGILPEEKSKTDLSVLVLEKEFYESASNLVDKLRENGIKIDFDFSYRKLEKQIKSAEKKGIENILIFGENELNNNKFTLKNILSGDKKENLSLEEIIEILS